MKPYIGAEVYANRVCSLFADLPNFETFDTAVDIIDLDGDDGEASFVSMNVLSRTPPWK